MLSSRHNRTATGRVRGARSAGPLALAALASPACAVGALAIANLAVRRAAVGRMRIKALHIDHLIVEEAELRHRDHDATEAPSDRTEANRRTIREAFDAWHAGAAPITDVFAAEMVWRIEGHSLASKQYDSRQQFVDEVLTPFAARFAASDPFRPIVIRSVHADGDTVVVVWDGRGVASDGQPYENSYAWVMKMRAGKVIDGTAFYDSSSFNDLWTRVTPG